MTEKEEERDINLVNFVAEWLHGKVEELTILPQTTTNSLKITQNLIHQADSGL
jgi:hypothetical protein